VRKSPCFEFYRRRFGDQRKVGYKDIIPLFKAEKSDAEAWARLFAEAGAKFAGPVAIHHDNFAMWDSALTRWDDPKERLHWLARVEKAGKWLVRLEVSAGAGPSALKLSVEGHSSKAAVPRTAGWFDTERLCFAPVAFEKPGVYHFTLEAGDPAHWRPVNLWKIELGPLPGE